jgi:hypothetical protein
LLSVLPPFVVTLVINPEVTTVASPVTFTAGVTPLPDATIAYQFQINGWK